MISAMSGADDVNPPRIGRPQPEDDAPVGELLDQFVRRRSGEKSGLTEGLRGAGGLRPDCGM